MAKRTSRTPKAAASHDEPQDILDGTLSLRVRGGELDGKVVAIDVMSASLACEALTTRHGVYEKGWKATPEFLRDLTDVFRSEGVEGCTASLAYQLWHKVTKAWSDLKKNMSELPK